MPAANPLLQDKAHPTVAVVAGVDQPAKPQAIQTMTGMAPTVAAPQMENDGVASRVADITGMNSPIMKQARSAGMRAGNARGLVNSSIAIGAAEDSAYKAAVPIASQEAAQAAGRNSQRIDIAAQMDRLSAQAGFDTAARDQTFGHQTKIADQQSKAEMDRLNRAGEIDLTRDAAQAKSQQELVRVQGDISSKLQAQGNSEQMQRMAAEFAQQTSLQASEQAGAMERIKASGDIEMQKQAVQIEAALKEVTLSLNQRNSEALASSAVQLFQAESALRAALMQNDKIPAAQRAAYEQSIAALTGPTREFLNGVLGGGAPTGAAPASPVTGMAPTVAPAEPAPLPDPVSSMAPIGQTRRPTGVHGIVQDIADRMQRAG